MAALFDQQWMEGRAPLSVRIPWDTVSGHLLPSSDLALDVGSPALRWRTVYAGSEILSGSLTAAGITSSAAISAPTVSATTVTASSIGTGTLNATGTITGVDAVLSGSVQAANVIGTTAVTAPHITGQTLSVQSIATSTLSATGTITGVDEVLSGSIQAANVIATTAATAPHITGQTLSVQSIATSTLDATGTITGVGQVLSGGIQAANVTATSGISTGTLTATGTITGTGAHFTSVVDTPSLYWGSPITCNADFLPAGTRSLGSALYPWSNLYASALTATNATLGGTLTAAVISSSTSISTTALTASTLAVGAISSTSLTTGPISATTVTASTSITTPVLVSGTGTLLVSNLVAQTPSGSVIGSAVSPWQTAYIDAVSSTLVTTSEAWIGNLKSDGSTIVVYNPMEPNATSSLSIGSTSKRWLKVWADSLAVTAGVACASATVSGALSSASAAISGALSSGSLSTGTAAFTKVQLTSNNSVDFGVGVAGKEANAGRVGYELFSAGYLDIVGAGTTAGSRWARIYDHLAVAGQLTIGGAINCASQNILNTGGNLSTGTVYSSGSLTCGTNLVAGTSASIGTTLLVAGVRRDAAGVPLIEATGTTTCSSGSNADVNWGTLVYSRNESGILALSGSQIQNISYDVLVLRVDFWVSWDSNGSGTRTARIYRPLTGAFYAYQHVTNVAAVGSYIQAGSSAIALSPGDYCTINVAQDSGSTLNINAARVVVTLA